jgi:DNA-binding response OmpR family regulator
MGSTSKKKILLVDDDKEFVNLFTSIIESEGYIVEVAFSGQQALDKFKKSAFDLLILDIKLPDMNGDKVAKKVRDKDKNIVIIIITGFPELQESITTLDIGIHDILLKPISSSEILRSIKEAFNFLK